LYGGLVGMILFIRFHYLVLFGGFRMFKRDKNYLGLILLIPYFSALLGGQTLHTKLMWFILAFNCMSLLSYRILPVAPTDIALKCLSDDKKC
jgi:hypothetical protein